MLAEDPRVSEANPMFARVEHPGYGRFLTASSPLAFAASPRVPPAPAARIGDHTALVLGDVLGLSPDAVAALRAERIVGGPAPAPSAPTAPTGPRAP
jgi:2-methylfumaryl-CoA isomerase